MQTLNLQKEYGLFINGEFTEVDKSRLIATKSPANGEILSYFMEANQEEVDQAVQAGKSAFENYKLTSKSERARMLHKIADVIEDNLEHLAFIETMDNGKPIRETKSIDIPMSADHFRYFASIIEAEEGTVNTLDQNRLSIVLREPYGVVGQIIPWNFPFLMAAWKLAPALAAGNTIVLKPSSSTSLSILELMQLTKDIIPKGVVNVITGGGSSTGEYLLDHPDITKLAFTGSTEIGYHIGKKAAEKLIPATLELGGKSGNIFFEDTDMDLAMDGLLLGISFNQGQVCSAGSRVFVQESIYDEFVQRAMNVFKQIKIGAPWEPETEIGALISETQCNKVLHYIELAKKEGATIAVGGHRLKHHDANKGYYVEPTLITSANNNMRVAQEEIFGPVAVVIPFKDEKDVIQMVNDSEYGLAGGVFTKDINRAIRVARSLETGRVWINTYADLPAGAPFGGYKKSGIGRETHKLALDAYSQVKNIIINTSEKSSGLYKLY